MLILKKVVTAGAVVLALGVLSEALPKIVAKPTPFESASKKLGTDEQKLADEVTQVQESSQAISQADDQKTVVDQLSTIDKKRGELVEARAELNRDIDAYEALCLSKSGEAKQELAAIADPVTRRQVARRYEKVYGETGKRVVNARSAVDSLNLTLAQMDDLIHVRKVLAAVDTLQRGTQDLDIQVGHAQQMAEALSRESGSLLAKLSDTEGSNSGSEAGS